MAASETIQIASADATDRGVRRLAGKQVRADSGDKLGTLKDFVVDAPTGKVTYAVVSSGGFLGAGDTLRAIPCEALQRSTAINGFVVNIDPAKWSQIPAIDQADFNAGRINIGADQHRQLMQIFEVNGAGQSAATASGSTAHLRRASELRGKNIQAGEQKIGGIEEVVIDLEHGTAAALVDPAKDFASTDAKYLVPIQRLNLASTGNVVTTTLTRADFDQAQLQSITAAATTPSTTAGVTQPPTTTAPDETPLAPTGRDTTDRSQTVAGTTPPTQPTPPAPPTDTTRTDEQLSPTGRTSAEQTPQADAGLKASARIVRQALDQDIALAAANVQVMPENGKLVLRGSVRDQQTKSNVDRAAKQAASDAQIDNQITIENQNR